MGNSEAESPSLGESSTRYLATLAAKEREAAQAEVYKFARWVGWESPFSRLAGPAVAGYAEQISLSDTDYARKLEMVRGFLAYGKKMKWSQNNLATHLKTKKGKTTPTVAAARIQQTAMLTRERYDEMSAELGNLREKSRQLIADIQRAAADKDFRENAPLQYAREERGHVEGRIKELEEVLKSATIIDEKKTTVKSGVGDSILLQDLASGEECRFVIVDPREVDPARGKISIASPLGKALLGKVDGQTVEINAPAGKLRYLIMRIEH